jgi:hypothetical protein
VDYLPNNNLDEYCTLQQRFLDLEINKYLPKFRDRYREEYDVIFELMRYMEIMENKFVDQDASLRVMLLFSAVIEINRLFQSAVLLLEKGLPSAAKIIARTILELSIKMVEMIRNQQYAQEFLVEDICEARCTINKAKKYNKLDLFSVDQIEKTESIYQTLGNKAEKVTVKHLAEKNNLLSEYLLYRSYCDNTHMSASALGENLKILPEGIVYDTGIQVNNFKKDLRCLISIVLISMPFFINEYFKDENMKGQYDALCEKFANIFQ